jgi:hypothetical protein
MVNEERVGLVEMIADTEVESPDISCIINRDYQDVFSGSNNEMTMRYFGKAKEIFAKKPLSNHALNQKSLLSQEDIIKMTSQIISKHKEQNQTLCESLASIFNVEYEPDMR